MRGFVTEGAASNSRLQLVKCVDHHIQIAIQRQLHEQSHNERHLLAGWQRAMQSKQGQITNEAEVKRFKAPHVFTAANMAQASAALE